MESEVADCAMTGTEWQGHILTQAFAGNRDRVRILWEEHRDSVLALEEPITLGDTCRIWGAIEALALIGDYEDAGQLYPIARGAMERKSLVLPYMGVGLVPMYVAVAAACAGDWGAAEEQFATTLEYAREIPVRFAEADSMRWHGKLLLELGDPSEADRARGLLAKALEIYHELGMSIHIGMVEGS